MDGGVAVGDAFIFAPRAFTSNAGAVNAFTSLGRLLCVFAAIPTTAALVAPTGTNELALNEGLVIESTGRAGRNTLFTDAVEARLVRGDWHAPSAGESITLPDGRTRTWTAATADTNGWFSGPAMRGGYAFFNVTATEPRVLLFNGSGHSMAYLNGEPRAGDVYQYGYVQTPVLLHPGNNEFLLAAGRGRLQARLLPPRAPVGFNPGDSTTPDLLVGEKAHDWAAVVVVNATTNWTHALELSAQYAGHTTRTAVPSIPPLGVRKVGFLVNGPAPKQAGKAAVELLLRDLGNGRRTLDSSALELRVRTSDQTHKRTFVSDLDGSVQYYAINPGTQLPAGVPPALFLSFHGASVQGLGQAEAYAPKRWGHIVSPTNRRPYGFDWEDWGRLDALEVLGLATARLSPDPSRIYLTGHSMGGHGTWNFGATFPDRFAAIAPSAGWISFFSYAGTDAFTNATPVERMLRRSNASSDTLALQTNYLHQGIYIVHGDADDNVPVTEARRMREELGRFHHDFDWYEHPGAGHWWGNSDEPGAACVDWPPMFDFFARHRIPADTDLRRIQFVTVNPGVSSRSHWVGIEAQQQALVPSEVKVLWDPMLQRLTATTRNVQRLVFETRQFGNLRDPGLNLEIDGQKLPGLKPAALARTVSAPLSPGDPRPWQRPLQLEHVDGHWREAGTAPVAHKNPRRNGPFKDAFRHQMIFVYGTHGTPEENAWALARARFDAEAFWYRGNGAVEVMSDSQFEPAKTRDRGVILYGHSEMNSAWPRLLAQSPVQVRRGEVKVGERTVTRDDLACLFLQPRPDSAIASVGVVAGTGIRGLRLNQRLPYFMAGTGYPDCLVLAPEFLEKGTAGIVTAGFFGNDWSVATGDFAWGN